MRFTVSISKPAFFQASKPPSKCPIKLSNPTRVKRVTVSSSSPGSVTKIIGCFTSAIKAPTQGAKSPLIPMFMDCGTYPFAKLPLSLVSKIKAPVSSATASNSVALIALIPLLKTFSKLSIPFLFMATFIPK